LFVALVRVAGLSSLTGVGSQHSRVCSGA